MLGKSKLKTIWKYRNMYLFLLPCIAFYFIFAYIPMYGITLGFKDYKFNLGIFGSPWAGLKYLKLFLSHPDFWKLLRNTLTISTMKLALVFPAPIILALMINEVRHQGYKKVVQTISYLPHFVSWVVVIALFQKILSPNGGLINDLLTQWFNIEPIYFMASKTWFYPIVVLTDIWKGVGWGTIIYLAAITGINPEMYEAADIDGAGKMRKILNITLPSLAPTIGILLILSLSNILKAGFDQLYLLFNPAIGEIGEVLDTYIVKVGIKKGMYSFATIIGMFQSFISLILVVTVNHISKKTTEISLW